MNHQLTTKTTLIAATIIGILIGSISMHLIIANAGSLDPTAPPGPTMKTLDEVEPRIPIPGSTTAAGPFVIGEPGSYYLVGDRVASGNGIEVNVNDVTIDLMGHSLIGPGSGTNYGIYMSGRSNVEIRNGTVMSFGSSGVRENDSGGKRHRIINIRALDNGYQGISLSGYGHSIKDCTVSGNASYGISSGGGSVVTGTVAYNNQSYGMYVGDGSTISNCTAYDNQSQGIVTGSGCNMSQCCCYSNSVGIDASSGNTVTDCTAYGNDTYGIDVGTASTIVQSTVYNNGGVGIRLWSEGIVRDCTVYSNLTGIEARARSEVTDCLVTRNDGDGIVAAGICRITGNSCTYNGQSGTFAGIHATGDRNHIEQNTVTDNDIGIDVDGENNIIIRNSASNSDVTDYDIVANNCYGPIVDVAGAGDISGTSNADHPWANFVY